MSCYLFTWHAYGSWLPDRPEGYVHWNRGLCESSIALAARYQQEQKQSTVYFTLQQQEAIIEETVKSAPLQRFRLHAVACEYSHVHVLASWRDARSANAVRRSLRYSFSLMLNKSEPRRWFSRGGKPQRVKTQGHFDYLYYKYLPSHSGMKWREDRGLFS